MSRGINTRCLHLEEDEGKTEHFGAISFPIFQTATYAHPGVGKSTGYDYSRLQNPTRAQVEKVVAELEGGIDAFALSSGMAAISLLFELFSPGDHIIYTCLSYFFIYTSTVASKSRLERAVSCAVRVDPRGSD